MIAELGMQPAQQLSAERDPSDPSSHHLPQNVGTYERLASVSAGAILAAFGLFRTQHGRLPIAALGAALVHRGVTGRCQAYRLLGVDTAHARDDSNGQTAQTVIPAKRGFKVEKSVTINRPAAELFAFWRDFSNLPKVMSHLKSVEVQDSMRSHWVAVGPLGREVAWDAELIDERPNETISWRSLPGSDVDTAGSVHFNELKHGRGTEVAASLKYNPPAGSIGGWIATLLGDDPAHTIASDLRRFKQAMEAGEVPTSSGQPSGRAG
jgi:uncharacterized membrane protein